MSEFSPNPQFEKEVREALAAPQPDPEFVKSLHARLRQQASPRVQPVRLLFVRRAWLAPAALLLIVVASTLIIGPQRVWAAVTGLFGYVPEIGVVRNDGSLRLLAEPVRQDREGVTLQVQKGATDGQRTVVIYQADGLSIAAANSQGEAAATGGPAALLLPDGSILTEQGAGGPGWGTGYQSRLTFPPIPAGVSKVTLLISRLQSMPAGAAPEDWRIPLEFKPAPPDQQLMPVYELATSAPQNQQASRPTSTPALSGAATTAPTGAALTNTADLNGVHLSLDRVVDQGDGFLLEGSATWNQQKYASVNFNPFVTLPYSLVDANGSPIPFEEAQTDNGGSTTGTIFALRTNNKAYAGPWKLTVPSLLAYQQLQGDQAAFVVDFGSDPKVGQTWQFDQQINAAGHTLRLVSARLDQDPRSQSLIMNFTLAVDPDVTGVILEDKQNLPAPAGGPRGGGGGGGSDPTQVPGTLNTNFAYYQNPAGKHRIEVHDVMYTLAGPWQVAWTPPQVAGQAIPTQPAGACLNLPQWQQLMKQPAAALPAGLSGKLLVEKNTGQLMPQLTLLDPAGSQPRQLAIGGWSALSPDGSKAVFNPSDKGLSIQDVQTGEVHLLPGSLNEDYHGMWSPDGQWIAFVRSLSGIYVIHPDGSGLTQVTTSATLSFLAGWLPDNRTLVITTLGAGGSQVQTVDIQTRKVEDKFTIKNAKGGFARVSPDGTRLAFSEMVFGLPSYGVYVANLDGSDKRLIAGLEAGGASAGAWSPDGRWLAVGISEESAGETRQSVVAVQPDTCQAVYLPALSGQVSDWKK